VFGITVGIFFWRRRVARIKADNYTAINDNDLSMTALGTSMTGGPRTTRELYDAFGEVSDDDDDDETTALRQPLARSVGFHSGFLDDDEPSTAAGLTPKYRDEPDPDHRIESQLKDDEVVAEGLESPTGSGGSWEHASRE
jgi:kexin